MRFLAGSLQPAVLSAATLIVLVYLGCLGGVLAAQAVARGRPSHWLTVVGALLFVVGVLWGHASAHPGPTLTMIGAGIALSILGIALDLIFGPPLAAAAAEEPERIERGFK